MGHWDAAWVMKQEVTATAGTSCRCSPKVLRRQMWRAGMPRRGNLHALRHVYCLWLSEIITVSSHPSHCKKNGGLAEPPDFLCHASGEGICRSAGFCSGSRRGSTLVLFFCLEFVFSQRSFWSTAYTLSSTYARTHTHTQQHTHILSLHLFTSSMLAWSQHQHWLGRFKLLSP